MVAVRRGRLPLPRSVRVAFWEGVRAGLPVAEAGVAAGAGRTVWAWFREAGGVTSNGPARAGERALSLAEREEIALGRARGESYADIGRRLGRSRSVIWREVDRNSTRRGYRAVAAQAQAEARAARPKTARLAGNDRLRCWVQDRLAEHWSPEQIAVMLKAGFPDDPEMRVSHETIYQSVYVQGRGALRRDLAACLRTGRALRKPRRKADQRRGRIKDMVLISERPAEAGDRAVPGHWEGDLIEGRGSKSQIGTLVERATRFTLLVPLPGGKSPDAFADAVTPVIAGLPGSLRRSLAWDQGNEMQRHARIAVASGCEVYFCDPHSPWQRPSNENTNGLLRQYFPKGSDLPADPERLRAVADELNGRPRKVLGWRTPAEAMAEFLDSQAA